MGKWFSCFWNLLDSLPPPPYSEIEACVYFLKAKGLPFIYLFSCVLLPMFKAVSVAFWRIKREILPTFHPQIVRKLFHGWHDALNTETQARSAISWAVGPIAALLSLQTPQMSSGKQGSMCCTVGLCHNPSARSQSWPRARTLCQSHCTWMASWKSAVCSLISLGSCTHYGDLAACRVWFSFYFFPQKRKYHYNIKNSHLYFTPLKLTEQEFTVKGYGGEVALGVCSTPNT